MSVGLAVHPRPEEPHRQVPREALRSAGLGEERQEGLGVAGGLKRVRHRADQVVRERVPAAAGLERRVDRLGRAQREVGRGRGLVLVVFLVIALALRLPGGQAGQDRLALLRLGTFRFEVAPGGAEYQELQRRSRRRWSTRERYGLPPELEDLGRDAGRIDLRGSVWVEEASDIEALDDLRLLAGLDPGTVAIALPVFLGGGGGSSGEFLGLWAVTRLDETERSLRENGVPIRIDFRISLLEEGFA